MVFGLIVLGFSGSSTTSCFNFQQGSRFQSRRIFVQDKPLLLKGMCHYWEKNDFCLRRFRQMEDRRFLVGLFGRKWFNWGGSPFVWASENRPNSCSFSSFCWRVRRNPGILLIGMFPPKVMETPLKGVCSFFFGAGV